MFFIHARDPDRFGPAVSASENPGKDREERDRDDEAQGEGASVSAQVHEARTHDREDHSRSPLPVRWRNTDSRFGAVNERSRTGTASARADWSISAISEAGSETGNRNDAPFTTPPRTAAQSA